MAAEVWTRMSEGLQPGIIFALPGLLQIFFALLSSFACLFDALLLCCA